MTTEKDEKVKEAWADIVRWGAGECVEAEDLALLDLRKRLDKMDDRLDHSMLRHLPGLTHMVDEHEERLKKLEAHVIGLCNQAHSHDGTGEQPKPDDSLGVGAWVMTEDGLVCEISGFLAGRGEDEYQLRRPGGGTWYCRSRLTRIDPATCKLMPGDEGDVGGCPVVVYGVCNAYVWLKAKDGSIPFSLVRSSVRLTRRDPKNIKEKETP